MLTYNEMKSNHEVIKSFCCQNRHALTVVGGILAEGIGLANRDDYINFMNELTIDEFIGNYLTALLNCACIDAYKKVNSGKMGFYDFVEEYNGKLTRKELEKYMEEHV